MHSAISRLLHHRCGDTPLSSRSACLSLLVVLGLVSLVLRANALPTFPPVVTDAYHPKTGGNVASHAQSCQLCHTAPPKLNVYGADVKNALQAAHTKTLTPAILHSLDTKDSDGDGFDNATEFVADTLPGDTASKPAGTPPPKATMAAGAASGNASANAENPFDLHTLLLPKHAQHPVIVHFPIALFVISLFFDLIAFRRKDRALAAAGYLNLTVAAATSPVAIITGLLAWQFAYGGISLASFKDTLAQHLVLGVVSTVLIWVLWGMRFSKRREGIGEVKQTYIILGLIALMIISIAGHLGGYLSGVN